MTLPSFQQNWYIYPAIVTFGILSFKIGKKSYEKKVHSWVTKMFSNYCQNQSSRVKKSYIDKRIVPLLNKDQAIKNIWSIGGENGWYAYNWAWQIRGYIDGCIGGARYAGPKNIQRN